MWSRWLCRAIVCAAGERRDVGALSQRCRKPWRSWRRVPALVYMVSYDCDGPVNDLWFSYYKDTRPSGGRLKLGHGPGGPPVLGKQQLLSLVAKLVDVGIVSRQELTS